MANVKPDAARRKHLIGFRLTDSELDSVNAAAAAAQVTPGDYIRAAGVAAATRSNRRRAITQVPATAAPPGYPAN